MSTDTTFLGIDGCRGGWIYAATDGEAWSVGAEDSIRDVLAQFPEVGAAFVDIPIGLREETPEERVCDRAARSKLTGRTSTVFPAPSRPALSAPDYETACDVNEQATGRRLSTQCWAIVPKVREVDTLLREDPRLRDVVREVHPEVCFWALAGEKPMKHSKRDPAGVRERIAVLRPRLEGVESLVDEALAELGGRARRDDVVDALAAAVTAYHGRGEYRTLPEEPEQDPEGLPMEMVYWVPEEARSQAQLDLSTNDENDPSTLTARYSRALTFSYRWHREQIRKGRNTPYLAHLMSVSALVLEAGGDEELGIAGLLHDALEDAEDEDEADARRDIIRREFGERVLEAVEGCTDGTPAERKQMTWTERKQVYVAHIRNEAIADAVAVSLCDKLHNARSILRDVREAAAEGAEEAFWERFTGKRRGSLWYYSALQEAYGSRVPALTAAPESGPRLPAGFRTNLEELGRTVDALLELTGVDREALAPPAQPTGETDGS